MPDHDPDRPTTSAPGSGAEKPPSFLMEFLRNPMGMAAVAPSSRWLARAMLDGVDLTRVRTVVEYGPGTGVFTRHTAERLRETHGDGPGFRHVAIELNERLASRLGGSIPGVEVRCASADVVEELVGPRSVDLVVSGLGWPSLSAELRRSLLEKTARVLRPGGMFRTFGYHIGLTMPGAWDFRRRCRALFASVEVSPVVWRNVPPAFVYRCVGGEA